MRGDCRDQAAREGPRNALPDDVVARLAQTLEAEVIPRLMRAHRSARAAPAGLVVAAVPDALAIAAFTDCLLGGDQAGAARYVDAMQVRGATFESLCFDLLAPAARRLGEMWVADDCDFAAVSAGTWEIRRVLREAGPQFASATDQAPTGLCALLVATPEELHTLGVAFAVEFFRRAGWDIEHVPAPTTAMLATAVHEQWYDVAGLAIATERRLAHLAASIRAIREASRNPAIVVLVGGSLVEREPQLVAQVGADTLATDSRTAPALARDAVAAIRRRR